jgi:hypothetical protein
MTREAGVHIQKERHTTMARKNKGTVVVEDQTTADFEIVEPTAEALALIEKTLNGEDVWAEEPTAEPEDVDEEELRAALEEEVAADSDESNIGVLLGEMEDMIRAGKDRDSKSARIRLLNGMGVPSATIAKALHCRYQQVFVTLKRCGLSNIRVNMMRNEVEVPDEEEGDNE